MESLMVNKQNQKGKKLKTRKNLDAIRKKSRKNLLLTRENNGNDVDLSTKNKSFAAKTSFCITTNRLTLFRKAISSDTVTRRIIGVEKNKKKLKNSKTDTYNLIHPLKEQVTNIFTVNSGNQNVKCVSQGEKCTQDSSISDIRVERTPDSIILFSPLHRNGELNISETLQINTHQSNCVLSDLSPSNNLYSQKKLYKNFMNAIPNYLQETASIFLKTNFVNKSKNSLRNLCMEDDHLNNEESLTSHSDFTLSHSDHDGIFHNPLDLEGSSYQTVPCPELVSSPSLSTASHSTIRESSSPLSYIMSDSPEYIYYPHKLNQ
ncbi:unnamed protein product [Euphydryas editha]|uniref:Uncharacterized protein n=1 Tax=Euphydryas editha TaxID=104508 RepID=A0AAU9TK54_EUPED|nr:unnamed protein product [Euphydryas editha]